MTATFATRRSTLRTASHFIATLALAVSLVACGDSISGPTSTPGGSTGTGSTGTGSTGTGTTTNTASIKISKSGYKDLNLAGSKGFSQVSRDTSSIYFEGTTSDGTAFAVLITAKGSKSGRYTWNDRIGKDVIFIIGSATYLNTTGETVITTLDLANGRITGSFSGTIASKTNSSSTFGISGNFDMPITR
jgi:hypothetical protein